MWTPVALSREVQRGLVRRVIAGTAVLLFRASDGRPTALRDACPHRGVPLSLGTLASGCVTCPFHGWRFDSTGACVETPWTPDSKKGPLAVERFATRERGGLIWLFTATTEPGTEPAFPPDLDLEGTVVTGSSVTWATHWTRAVENMVDDSHLPFVHPRTIGKGVMAPGARLTLDVIDEVWGWSWRAVIDGTPAEWASELRYPNVFTLRVPVPGRRLGIVFAAVPETEARVRIIQLGFRDFLRPRLFDPVFRAINRRVLDEDRRVVEANTAPVPRPAAERSLPPDALALKFRARLFATREEGA